ncbi:hypothetical protein T492DRAFT_939075 [Pavlovales sp. CCMP2436]|nr:hypothetical protein T492DRAFT_939075 [Pavlovales sp. CCMP2436]
MGFPERFVLHPFDSDMYHMLGNAVCPPVVALLGGLALAASLGQPTGAPGEETSPLAERELAVGAAAALLVLATPPDERRDALLARRITVTESRPGPGQSAPEALCDGLTLREAIERARPLVAGPGGTALAAAIFADALSVERVAARPEGWPAWSRPAATGCVQTPVQA